MTYSGVEGAQSGHTVDSPLQKILDQFFLYAIDVLKRKCSERNWSVAHVLQKHSHTSIILKCTGVLFVCCEQNTHSRQRLTHCAWMHALTESTHFSIWGAGLLISSRTESPSIPRYSPAPQQLQENELASVNTMHSL